MNDEIKLARGQIWYLKFNDAVGSEEAVGRPAIIVSSYANVDTLDIVTVVYLTTKPKRGGTAVEINSSKARSWAMCNQIYTVDKSRLLSLMGEASAAEMERVNLALRKVLVLPTKMTDEEKADIAKIGELEDKIAELEVELAVQKRVYEKALDRLAEFKFVKDAPMIPKVEKNGLPVIPTDVRKLEEKFAEYDKKLAAEPEQMTLNLEPLKKIAAVEEPKPKATRKPRVKKAEPAPKKANVNTDDADTLATKTGMAIEMANRIVEMREKYGGYDKLANLCIVPGIGKVFMEKYTAMLEV